MARGLQRLRHIAMRESIFRQHILRAHGECIFNGDSGWPVGNFDFSQPRRAPRNLARFRDDCKNHLPMKLDHAFGKDGIIAKCGAAIIQAGNVLRRQHGGYARKTANRIQVKNDNLSVSVFRRIARLHMKRAVGLAHVVDIDGGPLHMQHCAVMGERKPNRFRFKYARGQTHLRLPPHEHR